jgi:hypothetical protein
MLMMFVDLAGEKMRHCDAEGVDEEDDGVGDEEELGEVEWEEEGR